MYGFDGARLGLSGHSTVLASCPVGSCDSLRGFPTIIDVETDGDADLLLTIPGGTVGVTPIGNVYLVRQVGPTP